MGELTGQRERQTLLRVEHAVALTLAETTTASETYRNVLAAIGESLGWSIGAAWEHEQADGALHCVELWEAQGEDAADFSALSRELILEPVKACRGVSG